MGDFDILQANDAKGARKVQSKVQNTLRLKKALKKAGLRNIQGPVPTTNVLAVPGPITPATNLLQAQAENRAFLETAAPFGGVAQVGTRLGLAGLRGALRTPGIRQLAERFAGRPTTLPRFTTGEIFRGAAIAAGTAATIEGVGQLAERFGPRLGFGQQGFIGPVQAPQRSLAMPAAGTGRSMSRLPGVGGSLPPGTTVVKVWNTGTAQFARLLDGRIAVQKKDGTIKVYRPQKHIVIPRNPRVGTLIRADKRLERLTKGLRKVVRSGKR